MTARVMTYKEMKLREASEVAEYCYCMPAHLITQLVASLGAVNKTSYSFQAQRLRRISELALEGVDVFYAAIKNYEMCEML